MKDALQPSVEDDFTFARGEPFSLDSGAKLRPVTLRYAIYGRLNHRRSNVILVCHALSGSARVADWWPEMIGPERLLDTSRYAVICVNVIGSCYGSTGPRSIDPQTARPFARRFPVVTLRDMVRAQKALIDHLGVRRLRAVIGGSTGGMQALEWAIEFPRCVERVIAIAAVPISAMGLALNHLQRQAIRLEAREGLALARAIAICSYKSAELFDERFNRRPNRTGDEPSSSIDACFDVAGYLDHQGEKFIARFDSNSYTILSKAMDLFEIARDGSSAEDALRRITASVLLIGVSSDWLFPARDVKALAEMMRRAGVDASYRLFESSHGHDAFLADATLLARSIEPFLRELNEEFEREQSLPRLLAGNALEIERQVSAVA
jgi:homoserine O-acetyltransferase